MPSTNPALFVPVQEKWVAQAIQEFKAGAQKIYFSTNSNGAGPAFDLPINSAYFKITGENFISVKADFIEITENNPKDFRMNGNQGSLGKYYYGFCNMRWLKNPKPLSCIKRYGSGLVLRNDVPNVCIIEDPGIE